jgi:hypothetical protein
METSAEQIQFLLARVRELDARLTRIEDALTRLQKSAEPPTAANANTGCLPALAAIPEIFTDTPVSSRPAPKARPTLTRDAPWEKWRAEWERLRDFRGAVGRSAPPTLHDFWSSVTQSRTDAAAGRPLSRALVDIDAWMQTNPPTEPELAATLQELHDKISAEYQRRLSAIPAHRQWQALDESFELAKNDASAPSRACMTKGAEALWDWHELIERDGKWWGGDLYDHKTALLLTDVFDELNQAYLPEAYAALLQNLEAFLNVLCVCRDTRLKLGALHGTLPTELQNGFTDDKTNRPARPVSLQKVARIKRWRWVRVDSKGAPVSELCKASYELV